LLLLFFHTCVAIYYTCITCGGGAPVDVLARLLLYCRITTPALLHLQYLRRRRAYRCARPPAALLPLYYTCITAPALPAAEARL
jgi:hypothetical protein